MFCEHSLEPELPGLNERYRYMAKQQEMFQQSAYLQCRWCTRPLDVGEDPLRDCCDARPPQIHLVDRSRLNREYEAELLSVNSIRIASGLQPIGCPNE